MARKSTSTKTERKVNPLLVYVLQGFTNAMKMPTPGQIRAFLQKEHGKRIDYTQAKSLQGMAKRRLAQKGEQNEKDADSRALLPSGRSRHSATETTSYSGRARRSDTYGR